MKAIILTRRGGPDVLKVTQTEEPVPGKGEVRVALEYAGVNYAEVLSRKGLYGWAPKKPYILGMEGTGIIDAVGPSVESSRIGQSVVVGNQHGCYAEKIVVPASQALPTVKNYNALQNAAFLVNYMTAWVALIEVARLQPDESVLITAAAGGVGTAAVQLMVTMGNEVYGLAGSEEKIAFLKNIGIHDAFNYRCADWNEQLIEKSQGVNVILEVVGGDVYKKSFDLLRPFGKMVIAGFASLNLKWWNPYSWWQTWRDIPRVNIMDYAIKSAGVMATHLGYLLKEREKLISIYRKLVEFLEENKIVPVIDREFPLEKVAEAHSYIENRMNIGKVLLRINK